MAHVHTNPGEKFLCATRLSTYKDMIICNTTIIKWYPDEISRDLLRKQFLGKFYFFVSNVTTMQTLQKNISKANLACKGTGISYAPSSLESGNNTEYQYQYFKRKEGSTLTKTWNRYGFFVLCYSISLITKKLFPFLCVVEGKQAMDTLQLSPLVKRNTESVQK